MVGVVLVTENHEASEMLKTVRRLLGRTRGVTSVILRSEQKIETMKKNLKRAIDRVQSGGGVLLLTDIYGSTQCNVCFDYIKKGSVELLTGFNLPMLVKLGILHEEVSFKQLIPFIEEYGKEQIRHISSKNQKVKCS